MQKEQLIQRALESRKNAYAPYSRFSVGAALLTENGKIFDGVNVENASYGLTICAERSAVVSAVSAGERKFKAIAVACGEGEEYCSPCGACRQVLAEFNPDMEVIMINSHGKAKTLKLSELLPFNFSLEGEKQDV